jgi:hypothetical protein
MEGDEKEKSCLGTIYVDFSKYLSPEEPRTIYEDFSKYLSPEEPHTIYKDFSKYLSPEEPHAIYVDFSKYLFSEEPHVIYVDLYNMRVKWKEKEMLQMRSDYELVKANVHLKGNTMLMQLHKFKFAFEAHSRLNMCEPYQRTKKINVGELLKSHPPDQLPLVPKPKDKTQIMWPLATHGLPLVRRRQGRPSHFTDMRVKWKEKKMLQMQFILILGKTNVNKNSWSSFFEVGEKNGRWKTQDLLFMIDVGAVGRYGESNLPPLDPSTEPIEDWPPQIDPSTESIEDWPLPLEQATKPMDDCPPPLEQHVQWKQITKAMEELGNYLFKNQLLEEQPCFQENSRTSFVLEGVPDVGQDFHLVPKMPLLPRGSNLTLELWPNELIHEQLYRWHQVDMRKAIFRHWKYKRKKATGRVDEEGETTNGH